MMHSNSRTKKVLDFLRKNAPHSYNARTISGCIHIPEKTVRICLYHLVKRGLISRLTRGFYQVNIDISLLPQIENPPTTLHGITLESKTTEKLQKCIHGIPCKEFTEEALRLFAALDFLPTTNYRYYRNLWFEGKKITITIHLKGKVDVHISSSKNPLNYTDFTRLLTYLDGFLDRLAPFRDKKIVQVLQIGIAKDFRQLRLDGVKSVSLKNFTNAWARIYYKDDIKATRIEHHITGRMTLDDALKSLSILTSPVNYRRDSEPDSFIDVT